MDVVQRKHGWDRIHLFIGFVWGFFFKGPGWVKTANRWAALLSGSVEKAAFLYLNFNWEWTRQEEIPHKLPPC